jgi:hypothetical protein
MDVPRLMPAPSPIAWSIRHLIEPLREYYAEKNKPRNPLSRAGMQIGVEHGGGNGRAELAKPRSSSCAFASSSCRTYGARVVEQAWHLGGLAMCMVAMAHDELTSEERASAYQTASGHLSGLLEPLMPPGHASKVNECAKRLDSAVLRAARRLDRRPALREPLEDELARADLRADLRPRVGARLVRIHAAADRCASGAHGIRRAVDQAARERLADAAFEQVAETSDDCRRRSGPDQEIAMAMKPNLDQGNVAAKRKNMPGPLAKTKRTNLVVSKTAANRRIPT